MSIKPTTATSGEVTETFEVAGMTCAHCAQAVTSELCEVPGVQQVHVDVPSGRVTVTSTQSLSTDDVRTAIDEAGYQLV